MSAHALPDGARYHRDNVVATLSMADGSIANIVYVANGDRTVPKEQVEVFCEGSVAILSDFDTLSLIRNGKTSVIKGHHDKGHKRELRLTVEAISRGLPSPIPFSELVEVTQTTFTVHEAVARERDMNLPVSESDEVIA